MNKTSGKLKKIQELCFLSFDITEPERRVLLSMIYFHYKMSLIFNWRFFLSRSAKNPIRPKFSPTIGVEFEYANLEADKKIPSPPIERIRSYFLLCGLLRFSPKAKISTNVHFLDKYLIIDFVSFFLRKDDEP